MDCADNADSGAFFEVARDKLRGLSPSVDGDEIGLLLLILCVPAIDREGERRNGNSALGLFQLGVCGKPACKNDLVQIKATHSVTSFAMVGGMIT